MAKIAAAAAVVAVIGKTGEPGSGHRGEDESGAQDVGRKQTDPHPSLAAADAVLHFGEREQGNADQSEVGGKNIGSGEVLAEQVKSGHAGGGDNGACDEGEQTAAADECAVAVELARLPVFGEEAHHGGVEAQVGDAAEDEDPGPNENVNAVVVAADPARHHDLREIEKCGTRHAQTEGRDGIALRARAVVPSCDEVRHRLADFCDHGAIRFRKLAGGGVTGGYDGDTRCTGEGRETS